TIEAAPHSDLGRRLWRRPMPCPGPGRFRIWCDVIPFVKQHIWPALGGHAPPRLQFPHGSWDLVIGAPAIEAVAIAAVIGGVTVVAVVLWRALTKGQPPPQTITPIAATANGKDGPELSDTVNCSVFAPRRVVPRGKFKVQVYLHLLEDYKKVEREAEVIDPTANRRAFETLTRPIP